MDHRTETRRHNSEKKTKRLEMISKGKNQSTIIMKTQNSGSTTQASQQALLQTWVVWVAI